MLSRRLTVGRRWSARTLGTAYEPLRSDHVRRVAAFRRARTGGKDDLEEGLALLRGVTDVSLDSLPAPAANPAIVQDLDRWETEWFPVASATLLRHHPEVHARVFLNLSQTEGPAVMISVGTFVKRIAELTRAEGGYGQAGKDARKLLTRRGLTPAVIDEAKTLLEQVASLEAPLAEPVDLEDERARFEAAETAMWAWYLEWAEMARDYADQLRRGDPYVDLTPSIGIVWILQPVPGLPVRLHTVYELRERHTHERLTDQLAIHVLQPLAQPSPDGFGYHPQVERWARFLTATSDAEFDRLASEDPIMSIAKDALEQLSQDPATHRLARERADALKLHQIELAAYGRQARAEGEAKGRTEGEAKLVLKQLGLRFGPLSEAARSRVEAASIEQLDTWAERILTATTLDDVLAP